jgi:hypothetical protein
MSYDESGVPIYQAGDVVPAGYYARVDDGSYHLVLLEKDGPLPPSFDGHVALYRAAAVTPSRPTEPLPTMSERVTQEAQILAR